MTDWRRRTCTRNDRARGDTHPPGDDQRTGGERSESRRDVRSLRSQLGVDRPDRIRTGTPGGTVRRVHRTGFLRLRSPTRGSPQRGLVHDAGELRRPGEQCLVQRRVVRRNQAPRREQLRLLVPATDRRQDRSGTRLVCRQYQSSACPRSPSAGCGDSVAEGGNSFRTSSRWRSSMTSA